MNNFDRHFVPLGEDSGIGLQEISGFATQEDLFAYTKFVAEQFPGCTDNSKMAFEMVDGVLAVTSKFTVIGVNEKRVLLTQEPFTGKESRLSPGKFIRSGIVLKRKGGGKRRWFLTPEVVPLDAIEEA